MSKTEHVERAIIEALAALGRATARQIESDAGVVQACRQAKVKARTRIELMQRAGAFGTDQKPQGATYWLWC